VESRIANLVGKRTIVDSATGRLLVPAPHTLSTHLLGVLGIPRMNGVGEGAFGFGLGTRPIARVRFVKVMSRHLELSGFQLSKKVNQFLLTSVAVSISRKKEVALRFYFFTSYVWNSS
jgi:hypothetical protein